MFSVDSVTMGVVLHIIKFYELAFLTHVTRELSCPCALCLWRYSSTQSNLGTRWRRVVSFRSWLIYLGAMSTRYPLPSQLIWMFWGRQKSLPPPDTEKGFLGFPARSLTTVLTEASRRTSISIQSLFFVKFMILLVADSQPTV